MPKLITKVRQITQSKTSVTSDNQVIDSLVQGARYVISGLPANKLWFAAKSTNITVATGIVIDTPAILEVRRGAYHAEEIPANMAYTQLASNILGTTSIHKATNMFPVYYKRNGKLYIKPDPTALETTNDVGWVTFAAIPTTITADSTTWSIGPVEHPAINYAAAMDFGGIAAFHLRKASSLLYTIINEVSSKLSSFATALPTWSSPSALAVTTTAIASALQSAFNFVYGTTGAVGPVTTGLSEPNVFWLDDEDPEMARGYIESAAQELNRARLEAEKQQVIIQEYNAKVQKETGRFNAEANLLQNRIGQISAVLNKTNIVSGHYQKVQLAESQSMKLFQQAEKEMAIILNSGMPIQPQREGQ